MTENLLLFNRTDVPSLPGASIVSTGPGSVTLALFGEVDTFGGPILDAALEVVWSDAPHEVLVDLTQVSFLSVSALHSLLAARRTAGQRGVGLTLMTGSRQILRLLHLAGVDDVRQPADAADAADGSRGEPTDRPALRRAPRRGALALVPHPAVPRVAGPPVQSWPATAGSENALLRTLRSAAAWSVTDDLQCSLESVCAAAAAAVPGADGAGVRLVTAGHRGVISRAGTDRRAQALDVVHDRLPWSPGRGAAASPSWTDCAVVVDDLGSDPRWPDLAARAEELDVRSLLCLTLGANCPMGFLMVYASRAGVFTNEAVRLGQILAAVATIALPAAQRQHHLARALTTRDVIGQAKGILMERHKITAEQAFLVLSHASSVTNTKLGLLAEHVADTGEL